MAFDRISPIGDERLDQLIAMLTTLLYNINRGKLPAKQIIDFMPYADKKIKSEGLSSRLLNAFKSKYNDQP